MTANKVYRIVATYGDGETRRATRDTGAAAMMWLRHVLRDEEPPRGAGRRVQVTVERIDDDGLEDT